MSNSKKKKSPASFSSLPGSIIAEKYRIIDKLGEGGMGIVYKAEDIKLNRLVALKFLPPALTRDQDARDRFFHEAKAASALDHNNICTIYEINETEDEQVFIAMASYEGKSLKEKIKNQTMELLEAVDISLQVANGLAAAHKKGIIHRDIKPENIMITNEGSAKILDFGIAKLSGQDGLTQTQTTMGTVDYMSPEQSQGEPVDIRTDTWSLGVVMYEMVTGELPFKGDYAQAKLYAILNDEPEPAMNRRLDLPIGLEQIINRALAKNPKDRYASGKELAEALQDLKLRLVSGTAPIIKPKYFFKPGKRVLIRAGVGILVLALLFAAWILTRSHLTFRERDKMLVADVDNQTGEGVFDLALRTAIEADIQQSPFVRIFDRSEAEEILRLMRKDPATRIDEELGCDICRFAGVRVLVLPRILSAGKAYELQAVLVDPVKRRHVDWIRVTALGREEVLLDAIDKLARAVRSRLGESIDSIEKADEPIVKVTTSSWEALRYLALAGEMRRAGKFKEAEGFYRLALKKDPNFATARCSLGLLLIQFLHQKEKGRQMMRQALLDAEGLPQQEYLVIKALNRLYVEEDLRGALEEYRLMIDIYPDFWTAYSYSGFILREFGQFDEAVIMFEKAAELAPQNTLPLTNLWFTHLNYRKDPRAAEQISKRLIELGPELSYHYHWYGYSLMAQGKFREALKWYRKTVKLEPEHPYGLPNLAHLLLTSGAAADAVPIYREVRTLTKRDSIYGTFAEASLDLAIALSAAGDQDSAVKVIAEGRLAQKEVLERAAADAQPFLLMAQLAALAGDLSEAEIFVNEAFEVGIDDPDAALGLAEYYALVGKNELALKTLKKALASGYSDPYFPLIRPAFYTIRLEPVFLALFGIKLE